MSGSAFKFANSPTAKAPIVVTSTPYQMEPNNVYIVDMASRATLMLPTVMPLGATLNVINRGGGGWRIGQNSGQSIDGGTDTTTGTGGYIESQANGDSVFLRCITPNTGFKITSQRGTLSIV